MHCRNNCKLRHLPEQQSIHWSLWRFSNHARKLCGWRCSNQAYWRSQAGGQKWKEENWRLHFFLYLNKSFSFIIFKVSVVLLAKKLECLVLSGSAQSSLTKVLLLVRRPPKVGFFTSWFSWLQFTSTINRIKLIIITIQAFRSSQLQEPWVIFGRWIQRTMNMWSALSLM